MTKKENLQMFMDDLNSRRCVEIHLIWSNREKAGIGNPDAIKIALDALKAELQKQIDSL